MAVWKCNIAKAAHITDSQEYYSVRRCYTKGLRLEDFKHSKEPLTSTSPPESNRKHLTGEASNPPPSYPPPPLHPRKLCFVQECGGFSRVYMSPHAHPQVLTTFSLVKSSN